MISYTSSKLGGKLSAGWGIFNVVDVVQEQYWVVECNEDENFKPDYRFGFNGMHKDNELKGIGNNLDFSERIYDTRLGKFLSIDPLKGKYQSFSPYSFAGNTPIQAIDKNGLEGFKVIKKFTCGNPQPSISVVRDVDVPYGVLAYQHDNIEGCFGKGVKSIETRSVIKVGRLGGTVSSEGNYITGTSSSAKSLVSVIDNKVGERVNSEKQSNEGMKGKTMTTANTGTFNVKYEGKQFEVNATQDITTTYLDYTISKSVLIEATDVNSPYIKEVSKDLMDLGYQVELSTLDPSGSGLIGTTDPLNPKGISVSFEVETNWNARRSVGKSNVTSVKDVESGEIIKTPE